MPWQQKLLHWYHQHKRALPWRVNPTPYRVLVSEIMLQQTTVKAVIPYYRRFLKIFPSLKSLALAREEKVLTAWSGLGYYSRARNLQQTARICLKNYGGRVPQDVDVLKKLPGIGAYTAGAIASIAFDQPAPIVDGNVARVLARLFRIKEDPKTPNGQKRFWNFAQDMMVKKNCGDFNQALMELGATLCTPARPTCSLCPLNKSCRAYLEADPATYPKIGQKKNYRNVNLTAALLIKRDSLLMLKRPKHGALRDMWEFPMIEGDADELLEQYSLKLPAGRSLPIVRHSIMNQRIRIHPWLFELSKQSPKPKLPGSRFVPIAAIHELPTSSMVGKMVKMLSKGVRSEG